MSYKLTGPTAASNCLINFKVVFSPCVLMFYTIINKSNVCTAIVGQLHETCRRIPILAK